MTHSLTIKDNSGLQLHDLLSIVLSLEMGSRQISPLNNGRWQETYQLFAKSDNDAGIVRDSVFELDIIVKTINDYGDSPAYNSPIWLHEKSEGELTQKRRAPLFRASQQPIVNGAVGPLQINNGYIGLLTLERGDWENVTATATVINTADVSTAHFGQFGQSVLSTNGTVESRVASILNAQSGTTLLGSSVGFRPENLGTTNFQPCVSLGSADGAASGTGWAKVTNTAKYTQPAGQSNTYQAMTFDVFTASHTADIKLSDVSQSSADSVNKDYCGRYEAFLRFTGGTLPLEDAYVKVSLSYGYTYVSGDDDMVANEPIYIQDWTTAPTVSDIRIARLGSVIIPSIDTPNITGITDQLADFTFSLSAELVGVATAASIVADSIFLIPSEIATVSVNAPNPPSSSIALETTPNGDISITTPNRTVEVTASQNIAMPRGNVLVVYYNEVGSLNFPPTGTFTQTLSHVEKFNSLS